MLEPRHELANHLQKTRKTIIFFHNYIIISISDNTFATISNQVLLVFCNYLVPCYPFIITLRFQELCTPIQKNITKVARALSCKPSILKKNFSFLAKATPM